MTCRLSLQSIMICRLPLQSIMICRLSLQSIMICRMSFSASRTPLCPCTRRRTPVQQSTIDPPRHPPSMRRTCLTLPGHILLIALADIIELVRNFVGFFFISAFIEFLEDVRKFTQILLISWEYNTTACSGGSDSFSGRGSSSDLLTSS